jgi:hypothetical protein
MRTSEDTDKRGSKKGLAEPAIADRAEVAGARH